MKGTRHRARRLALQAIYALDANAGTTPVAALERAREETTEDSADLLFAQALTEGVWTRRRELDRAIGRVSRRWKVQRMDRVDRCVLRLSVHELLHHTETPAQVALDEGVELAKEFGTPDSPAFVNGILDRLAHEFRQDDLARPKP